jgi:hypothetical protein
MRSQSPMSARKVAVLLVLSVGVVMAAGCGTVGSGPLVPDMSQRGDLSLPMCTPKSCNGCCQNDVCQPGNTAQACGSSVGLACVQCTAAQLCGPDLQCAFDPNAMWQVSVLSAQFMTKNPLSTPPNMNWRADGTMPQPYVEIDSVNDSAQVAIVVSGNTWTASWAVGKIYAAKDLRSTGFDLQVLDQEGMMTPTPMSNKHHVTLSEQDFASPTLTYSGWEGVISILLNLQRQPE